MVSCLTKPNSLEGGRLSEEWVLSTVEDVCSFVCLFVCCVQEQLKPDLPEDVALHFHISSANLVLTILTVTHTTRPALAVSHVTCMLAMLRSCYL